jgi:hypothetical protein
MATYSATSTYGYCQYTVLADQTLEGFVTFYDLTTVSAAHIHSAVDGEPILVWLATSKQWETGVAQATPLANCPCCVPGKCSNPTCSLQSPPGTPRTKRSSRTTCHFKVSPPVCGITDASGCGICPWVSQGTVLNFHGYDFQYVKNGCPTGGSPGADMLESVPFTLLVTKP